MTATLVLSLLAPISIFFGLIVIGNVPLTFLLFHGCVCSLIPLLDLKVRQNQSWKILFRTLGFQHFDRFVWPGMGLGLLFAGVIYGIISGFQPVFLDLEQTRNLLHRWHFSNDQLFLYLFIMIFANSILEEIYWRGYIFHRLENQVSEKLQILLTALFYCSYHLITTSNLFSLGAGLLFTAVIFCTGLFWGWLRQKTASIYIPMISHLLADLGIMLIYIKYFV